MMITNEDIDDLPIRYDIKRMKYALAGEFIQVPTGLSRDEIHEFILSHSERLKLKDQEFCARLLLEARRYGWSGDYIEVDKFVESVFKELHVELPSQEDREPF